MQMENTVLFETIREIGLSFSELSVELTRILKHPAEKYLVLDVLVRDIMDQVDPKWEEYLDVPEQYVNVHRPQVLQLQRELQLLCADVETLSRSVRDPSFQVTGVNLISTNTFVLEFNLDEIYC